MSENAKKEFLFFIQTPNLDDLVSLTLDLQFSAISQNLFSDRILKCRSLIFLMPQLLASPQLQKSQKIVCVVPRYELDKCRDILDAKRLEINSISPVSFEDLQECLHYTIHAKMPPAWNTVGDYLVQGRQFLTGDGLFKAVSMDLMVSNMEMHLSLQPHCIKIPPMKIEHFAATNEYVEWLEENDQRVKLMIPLNIKCYVLPNMKLATLLSVSNYIPEGSPYEDYKHLKVYWKNMYGYRLPETDDSELNWYCNVAFRIRSNVIYTYPMCCVKSDEIRVVPRVHLDDILGAFLKDFQRKVANNICGQSCHLFDPKASFPLLELYNAANVIENMQPRYGTSFHGPDRPFSLRNFDTAQEIHNNELYSTQYESTDFVNNGLPRAAMSQQTFRIPMLISDNCCEQTMHSTPTCKVSAYAERNPNKSNLFSQPVPQDNVVQGCAWTLPKNLQQSRKFARSSVHPNNPSPQQRLVKLGKMSPTFPVSRPRFTNSEVALGIIEVSGRNLLNISMESPSGFSQFLGSAVSTPRSIHVVDDKNDQLLKKNKDCRREEKTLVENDSNKLIGGLDAGEKSIPQSQKDIQSQVQSTQTIIENAQDGLSIDPDDPIPYTEDSHSLQNGIEKIADKNSPTSPIYPKNSIEEAVALSPEIRCESPRVNVNGISPKATPLDLSMTSSASSEEKTSGSAKKRLSNKQQLTENTNNDEDPSSLEEEESIPVQKISVPKHVSWYHKDDQDTDDSLQSLNLLKRDNSPENEMFIFKPCLENPIPFEEETFVKPQAEIVLDDCLQDELNQLSPPGENDSRPNEESITSTVENELPNSPSNLVSTQNSYPNFLQVSRYFTQNPMLSSQQSFTSSTPKICSLPVGRHKEFPICSTPTFTPTFARKKRPASVKNEILCLSPRTRLIPQFFPVKKKYQLPDAKPGFDPVKSGITSYPEKRNSGKENKPVVGKVSSGYAARKPKVKVTKK